MNRSTESRTYCRTECTVFRKTEEAFGGLSNMAPGYPVRVNGVRIFTVEALYQACRFPHMPEVQRKIIGQHSPMTAKMVSKPYRKDSRPDWDRVRVKVMRWCLRMKLTQHWPKFSQLLLSTGDRPIVEDSRKDDFWGALPNEGGTLVGMNVLGRLLMELREAIKQGAELRRVEPPAITNFVLFGEPLQVVDFRNDKNAPVVVEEITAKDTSDELTLPLFAEAGAAAPARAAVMATALPTERSHGMIEGLKPYAEYRDSGHRWLGSVPSHWSVLPNRALFDEVKDRNHPKEEMLSVTITRGIVRQKALLAGSSKKDSSNLNKGAYKLVQPHDIAYNKMRAWQGALGASTLRGIISPAYVVMRPRKGANPWFYHNLYRTPSFAKEAERWSYGITSDMWSLRPEHFKVIGSILPPPDEQAAIVQFLDHANRKIDGFIRAKRKLIGLLNEQKQAIIQTAISKVSTPECKTMPVRAVLRPVKRMGHPNRTLLSLFRDYGVIPKDSRENKNVDVRDLALCQLVHPGDVVMNKMKAWQGSIAISGLEGIVSPDYMVLEFRIKSIVEDFFHYALRSPSMVANYRKQAYGVRPGQWRLMYPDFCRLKLPVPSIEEQRSIVAHIKSETAALTTAIARTEREIALMQEYRTRLTADLVTGKLDVREAAAQLPSPPAAAHDDPASNEPLEEPEPEDTE